MFQNRLSSIALALGFVALSPVIAQAGTDATFAAVVTTVTAWMTGSLGILLSLVAVTAGMTMTAIRASAVPVIAGIGVALVMQTLPGVIGGIVTATLDPALPALLALPASI